MRKQRDVKFIIYQSLYIFVVCVIAIKGANLDLVTVIADDGTPKVFLSPDSLQKLYEKIQKSVIVDTAFFVIVPKALLEENEKLRLIVQNMPKIDLNMYTLKSEIKPIEEKIKEEEKINPTEPTEIRIGQISLTQYTENPLTNPYDVPLEIVGITTIPPKSSKSFVTGGQSSLVIKVGNSSKTVELKPNRQPKINMQRLVPMGEESSVSNMQRTVCYRVTIDDDFPGQLDIKFAGPITFKQQGGTTFDITLNAFPSKTSFDNFTEGKDAPYSLGFTVSVSDRIAPHKITGQNSFIFGDW